MVSAGRASRALVALSVRQPASFALPFAWIVTRTAAADVAGAAAIAAIDADENGETQLACSRNVGRLA